MNLYRILVRHGGPKASHTAVETYLVAENEEQVVAWITRERQSGQWLEDEEGQEPQTRMTDGPPFDEISFRDYVMAHRGDIDDDEGWDDAYYGVTKWGWEEVPALEEAFINQAIAAGIAVRHDQPCPSR